jgi:hypothetical protein
LLTGYAQSLQPVADKYSVIHSSQQPEHPNIDIFQDMSLQSPPSEPARTPKGKGKGEQGFGIKQQGARHRGFRYLTKSSRAGARRVSNLSEEQRNKKRENDRIAQQNIRRRNKELIENLQNEVETLRGLKQVQTAVALARRVKELETQLHALQRTSFMHNGRPYPTPGIPRQHCSLLCVFVYVWFIDFLS